MRGRREYALRWESRAREIEELRDGEQQRAVASERVRVAREVHDVVGHHLAAIAVQARAGRRAAAADPSRVAGALAEIDALAGEALDDTRGALARITEESEPAPMHPVAAT
jgi:signal transduction histidine kinase